MTFVIARIRWGTVVGTLILVMEVPRVLVGTPVEYISMLLKVFPAALVGWCMLTRMSLALPTLNGGYRAFPGSIVCVIRLDGEMSMGVISEKVQVRGRVSLFGLAGGDVE